MYDQEQFRAVLDTSRDLFVVVNEDGTIRDSNAAVERILGYAPDELVGEDGARYVHPEDEPLLQTALEEASEHATTVSVESRVRAKDGSWVRLECRLSNEDVHAGYVVSAHEVTETGSEGTYERGRNRLQELAETSNEVLWMFTADWDELLFVNSAYEQIWGQSVAALRADACDFLDGVHPADRDRVLQAMDRLSNGTAVDIEYRVNTESGYSHWVWVQGEPVFEGDDVVRVVGFARDVSERHERTRQLQVIDRLLRHNLRNSMNIVLGYAAELDETTESATEEPIERLRAEGERLLSLADKQRELVDVLTTEVQSNPVEFGRLVEETVRGLEPEYPEGSITLDVDSTATVLAFPKIGLAVRELVVNALEHCEAAEPQVTVTVQSESETVVLEVADRNPPIPAQNTMVLTGDHQIEDLFHGDGVGLWLVYWLFERSNGDVTFTRSEPCGNCVRGVLPRSKPP